MLATYQDGLYNFTLFAHVLCAIVGFGAVVLNGVYAMEVKRRRGAEALAVAEANFRVTTIGEYFIYGVFVSGVLIVVQAKFHGEKIFSFSDGWVIAAMAIYIAAIGVSHAVMLPTVKRMLGLLRELAAAPAPPAGAAASGPPPQVAQLERLGAKAGVTGALLDLAFVAVLVLMVWKPGS